MGWEWARLTGQRSVPAAAAVILTAALPNIAMAAGQGGMALLVAAIGAAAVLVAARGAANSWAAFGALAIALPCAAALWLEREAGRATVLWLLVTVWASDSGAYGLGRAIGGPKLAPRVSPGKTWAGAVGGILGAAAVAAVTAALSGADWVRLIPAGLAIGVAAQLGDLAESLAKRRFGAKDAGRLIPGHGGLLDRLDAMLAAAALEWALTFAAGASPLLWRGSP